MSRSHSFIVLAIVAVVVAFFAFDVGHTLTLANLKSQQAVLDALVAARPILSALVFGLIYVAVAALSLPGAVILTLAGGALFGLGWGLLLVSFASSVGATLAFLISRTLLRDAVLRRFGSNLRAINDGVEKDGAFYLFGLRLVPVFPFFVINLVMGLTPIKAPTFYWVSQLGMLPGTAVFVNAGTQLAGIESLAGLLSPGLLLSFALLGVFPIIAKKGLAMLSARKVYQGLSAPKSFDQDMIVIGAGSGGLVSAYIAAAVKAQVTLIERYAMGGDCLNTGCVPSKALIKSARVAQSIREADKFGIQAQHPQIDFAAVMDRVHEVIAKIEPHDSVERYTELGVNVVIGEARVIDPWTVEVNGRRITARNLVIATGARPFVPPIPGLDSVGYYTSDNIWDLREQPKRLLVLGGGPIGCELTQAFHRLGSAVTQVDLAPRIMPREDADVAALVAERFAAEGVITHTSTKPLRFEMDGDQRVLIAEKDGRELRIEFDAVLVAVGRRANSESDALAALDLPVRANGTLEANEYLQVKYPNVFAVGDVVGPYQFTHAAAHMAWYAAVNALFGTFKLFKVDWSALSWATFTDPEVARVGLSEDEAIAQGIAYEKTQYGIDDLDRAIADGTDYGFVKVLTVPGKDKILGVTLVGAHAGELLQEFVLAKRWKLGLNKILGTTHAYPSMVEANKYAAGEWKRAHVPTRVLQWVAKYHAWRRN
ncbi:SidA/IucD/PvdA family monooxygenase [Litorivicinus lipolyticus]|uniref:SidA/IucD/PvdA family monooxygenase n=1 Tax=Litorivicinus lipolyticus TaxID=418701 RepID=A0A5Q2QA28_9GAMM|nr:bifunctional TVP38/TMEM64 family protein/FAD-dependent oxidoreductase [Litorivicinus lipolyticus]QGG79052.1 SidA/IucD/PvdA family monooxygenase [Litorivicinus lipolyticus]